MKRKVLMAQPGFFDLDNRYESISRPGDPKEVMDQSIPWKTFRPLESKALCKFKKSNAGRKPYDSIFMFKILVLQSLYKLTDDQTEFQIKDRLSFMHFLGLEFEDRGQMRKPFGYFEIRSQTKIPSTSYSVDSIGTSITKICFTSRVTL